jgi:hypothetical protein
MAVGWGGGKWGVGFGPQRTFAAIAGKVSYAHGSSWTELKFKGSFVAEAMECAAVRVNAFLCRSLFALHVPSDKEPMGQ